MPIDRPTPRPEGAAPRGDQKIASAESQAIAEQMRAEMRRLNCSQNTIARAIGASAGHVSKLLNGQRDFQVAHVIDAAAALGIPAYTLAPQGSRIAHLLAIASVQPPANPCADQGLLDARLVTLAKTPEAMTADEAAQARTEMLHLLIKLEHATGTEAGARTENAKA